MDAIAQEYEELKAGRKSQFKVTRIKLKEGLNRLRLLPPYAKGTPWRKVTTSFNNGQDKKTAITPRRQYGLEPDPFMDHIDAMSAKNDKATQAELDGINGKGGIRPRERYVMFVIDRDNEAAGPQAWEASGFTIQMISKWFANPDYGNLADPDNGFDINVTKVLKEKTKKKFSDELSVEPRRKESKLSETDETQASWLAEDLFEKYRIGFPNTVEFMEHVIAAKDPKEFKGDWVTRPDGTPVKASDEDGEQEQQAEVETARANISPAKGPSAADKIRAALNKKT